MAINSKSSFYVPMDVMRGDIDVTLLPTPSLINSYRYATDQGKLRVIATTGAERSPLFPKTPTVGETLKGYDSILWWAIFAPKSMAPAEVSSLKKLFDWAGQQEAKRLAANGVFIRYKTPEQLVAFLQAEQKEWEQLDKSIKFPRNDY